MPMRVGSECLKALCCAICFAIAIAACSVSDAAEKTVLAEGLNNPESAVVGADGKIYVTITGKPDAGDDGQVVVIEDGKATVFAKGLSDPRGIDRKGNEFYVADKFKVWRIDESGKATVFADSDAFPVKPRFLNDIEIDANGDVLVSESGTFVGNGAVYRIKPDGKVSTVCDTKTLPAIKGPNGVLVDGADHILLADVAAGKLHRVKVADGTGEEVASGVGGGDGIARDAKGRIYVGDVRGGKVFRIDGATPVLIAEGFKSAADITIDDQDRILVPDSKAGTLTALTIGD